MQQSTTANLRALQLCDPLGWRLNNRFNGIRGSNPHDTINVRFMVAGGWQRPATTNIRCSKKWEAELGERNWKEKKQEITLLSLQKQNNMFWLWCGNSGYLLIISPRYSDGVVFTTSILLGFFKVDLEKAFLHLPWAALGPPWLGCWPPLALPCVSGPLVPGHLGLGPAPRGRKNQCQLLKYSRQQSNSKTTAIKINDSSNY